MLGSGATTIGDAADNLVSRNTSIRYNNRWKWKHNGKRCHHLQKAGLTPQVIQLMASSRVAPTSYQVHYIVPLAGGGTKGLSNLVLIKNEPDHNLITAYQNSMTSTLSVR